MKIILTGSSGLIGKALHDYLTQKGHTILKLVRKSAALAEDERFWDPSQGKLDPKVIEGADALINLSGENIASGYWTAKKKQAILESRVKATRLLAETTAHLNKPPKVLLNASAVGFYGNRGGQILTEQASQGTGYLAEVCREWEAATEPAEKAGVRVVRLRFGVVLAKEGGALSKMLTPFKLGLGGAIGSGEQYMSWISIDDLCRLVEFALENPQLTGSVNAVSPAPVTNLEFTKTLGSILNRPTLLPVPAFLIKLFGEIGQEMLLSSTRAIPEKLQQTGFIFRQPDLKTALEKLLL